MRENINKPGQMTKTEVANKMKSLMGLNESVTPKSKHGFELIKRGPDGNAYAIVKENQEYFLKKAKISENLCYGDFNYIGGLVNKRSFVFESFSKATQSLNLRLIDLHENYGFDSDEEFNLFKNDMEVQETPMVALGDDIEFMPEEDVFSDEMTDEEMAIDDMINGTFRENDAPEEACNIPSFEDVDSIESMTDRVMEEYKKLNSILKVDDLKKKI